MLAYEQIAELIGPVAEHVPVRVFVCARSMKKEGGLSELSCADLACMELVRRLNALPDYKIDVMIESASVSFFDEDGEATEYPYTLHPLEAVAKFAAVVLGKERAE
jgi:hypothetical protein